MIVLIISILLVPSVLSNDVGYNEINLYNYKTNNFIHINSSISLLNYTTELKQGINWVGIPYNTSIHNANDLITSIPGMTFYTGDNVKTWNCTSQLAEAYSVTPSGYSGTNFIVNPCKGYEISIGRDTTWIIQCLQPTKTTILYEICNLNNYYGTNIIRPKRCFYD